MLNNDILERIDVSGYDLINHFLIRLFELILLSGFLLSTIIVVYQKMNTNRV